MAALRNVAWPAGPPTGAVSRRPLVAVILTPRCANRSRASVQACVGSPRFAPKANNAACSPILSPPILSPPILSPTVLSLGEHTGFGRLLKSSMVKLHEFQNERAGASCSSLPKDSLLRQHSPYQRSKNYENRVQSTHVQPLIGITGTSVKQPPVTWRCREWLHSIASHSDLSQSIVNLG